MTIISLRTRWLLTGLALAAALFFTAAPSTAHADGGGNSTNSQCNGNGGGCG